MNPSLTFDELLEKLEQLSPFLPPPVSAKWGIADDLAASGNMQMSDQGRMMSFHRSQ
jgi:hypothetical protein